MNAFSPPSDVSDSLLTLLQEQDKHLVPEDEVKDYVPTPRDTDDPQYLLVLLMR